MVGGNNNSSNDVLNEVVRRVKDFNRRIRDIEEKVRNINARINTVEDSILEKTKKLNNELGDVTNEVQELQDRMTNLESETKNLKRQTRKMVTRREFSELEDYMDIMTPVESSFMTQKEVENLIEKKLQERDKQATENYQ